MHNELLVWALLLFSLTVSEAKVGHLTILHHPPSLDFSGCKKIAENDLIEIYSAALGLSHNESSAFSGLIITDPFSTPEALVEIYVDGIADLDIGDEFMPSYRLIMNNMEPNTLNILKRRINNYQGFRKPNIAVIGISDENKIKENSNIFDDIKETNPSVKTYNFLKYNVKEDYEFLSEIELLKSVTDKIKFGAIFPNGYIDFFKIYVNKLYALGQCYGKKSFQHQEGKRILSKVLLELKEAFVETYKGSVLVTAITAEDVHDRLQRRIKLAGEFDTHGKYYEEHSAEATHGDADFAEIFNLLFWFGITYTFVLIGVVNAIFSMTPDQDSIIYRLTNPRTKREQ